MNYSAFIIPLAVIGLCACQPTPETPSQVTKNYWQTLRNNDPVAASKLVSKDSQDDLSQYFELPSEEKIPLDEIYLGAERAVVTTIIRPDSTAIETTPPGGQADLPEITFETVLILEDGQWKVDVTRTQTPTLQKPAVDAPSSDLDTAPLKEALQESAEVLNQFMREGSREMSETFLKGMNKTNEALREAIDKMKQQAPTQPPADENDGANGAGII